MKKQAYSNLIIRSSFAFALALSLTIWSPVLAQPPMQMDGKNMTEGKMLEQCREMKEKRDKMMAEMKAQDVELTAQIAKMNSAPKDKKLDLMAAVITSMVEQRTAMHAKKEAMQEKMIQHMMQHSQMGMESMHKCPMMKDMMDKKDMEGMKDKKDMEGMEGLEGRDRKMMDTNKKY